MRTRYTNFTWAATGEPQEMLVENGKVVAREKVVSGQAGETIDLGGNSLYPAFIDNHCHILPAGIDLGRLNLDPCSSREDILDRVRTQLQETEPGQWLRAVHYDQTKFDDGQHLTSLHLDKISTDTPILLRHV
ncbi:MAG: amidohydrolase family protein, partial [Fimbriimonadaceae bacterium]